MLHGVIRQVKTKQMYLTDQIQLQHITRHIELVEQIFDL